jgi:CBS domain-containing protein
MKVKDVMTKDVVSVTPEMKVAEVARLLFDKRFHGVPVVEKGRIVGIITESDFFTKDSKNLFLPSYINFIEETGIADALTTEKQEKLGVLMNARARDIMNPECVSIMEDMSIKDLLNFFRETGFSTLPVTDEKNNLKGVVTLADILGLIKTQEA